MLKRSERARGGGAMTPKIIKTELDHMGALARIEQLMDCVEGTAEHDEFELLVKLVEDYEDRQVPIRLPDPVAAIRFRMEQKGLMPKDIVPYLGSRSKVTEVLNHTRPLSLAMIRALNRGLGIPLEVLAQESVVEQQSSGVVDSSRWPVREMAKRGWFDAWSDGNSRNSDQLLARFVTEAADVDPGFALHRRQVRGNIRANGPALEAWHSRVLLMARELKAARYKRGTITRKFVEQLVGLSVLPEGPRQAREFLHAAGIRLVCEKHLNKTYVDGAALLDRAGTPIIALSLRHDRLDNFWFTLLHELGHVALHLDKGDSTTCFIDDMDVEGDGIERAADDFASEALIPEKHWNRLRAMLPASRTAVVAFAESLRIHPSIVAGRIRREMHNYRVHHQLVGRGIPSRQLCGGGCK
jgi:HTH-type transcriptional regulator / antitoxin HigA